MSFNTTTVRIVLLMFSSCIFFSLLYFHVFSFSSGIFWYYFFFCCIFQVNFLFFLVFYCNLFFLCIFLLYFLFFSCIFLFLFVLYFPLLIRSSGLIRLNNFVRYLPKPSIVSATLSRSHARDRQNQHVTFLFCILTNYRTCSPFGNH